MGWAVWSRTGAGPVGLDISAKGSVCAEVGTHLGGQVGRNCGASASGLWSQEALSHSQLCCLLRGCPCTGTFPPAFPAAQGLAAASGSRLLHSFLVSANRSPSSEASVDGQSGLPPPHLSPSLPPGTIPSLGPIFTRIKFPGTTATSPEPKTALGREKVFGGDLSEPVSSPGKWGSSYSLALRLGGGCKARTQEAEHRAWPRPASVTVVVTRSHRQRRRRHHHHHGRISRSTLRARDTARGEGARRPAAPLLPRRPAPPAL